MSVRIRIAIGIAGLLMIGAARLLLPGGSNQISPQLSEPEQVSPGALSPKVFPGRVSALQRIHELQREELRAAVGYLQELVEWALVLREQTLAFARVAEEQRTHERPLSGFCGAGISRTISVARASSGHSVSSGKPTTSTSM